MLSLNYENINYVMTQILKLSCVSFSYVSISYVLAVYLASHLRSCVLHLVSISTEVITWLTSAFIESVKVV